MKKFSKKGVLLFAAVMAVCAFAVPSMASAASWGLIGSEHTLDSPNLAFFIPANGTSSTCGESQFTVDVVNAAIIHITSATFLRCTATGPAIGTCTKTWAPTGLPWTATATATNNIQIHGIHIDLTLENPPNSTLCSAAGAKVTLTGTLTGGLWNGNAQHELILSNAPGLRAHSALGNNQAIQLNGTYRDTQQTLVVNP